MAAERIGIIGLGLMGLPMARNLHSGGYEVVALNHSNVKVRNDLEAAGFTIATSAAEVAAQADVVILMLPQFGGGQRGFARL